MKALSLIISSAFILLAGNTCFSQSNKSSPSHVKTKKAVANHKAIQDTLKPHTTPSSTTAHSDSLAADTLKEKTSGLKNTDGKTNTTNNNQLKFPVKKNPNPYISPK